MWFNKNFLIGGVFLLSGCGFQPLYNPHSESLEAPNLYRIKISRIEEREGQILRTQLQHALNPYGPPAHPLYTLTAKISFTRQDLGFRRDATPRRGRVEAKVEFLLTDQGTGKVVLADNFTGFTGFTLGSTAELSAFPEIVSEQDSKKRLLESLAQDIKLRISAYLLKSSNQKSS